MVESNNNMSLLVKFIKRVGMSVTDIHKLYKQAALSGESSGGVAAQLLLILSLFNQSDCEI